MTNVGRRLLANIITVSKILFSVEICGSRFFSKSSFRPGVGFWPVPGTRSAPEQTPCPCLADVTLLDEWMAMALGALVAVYHFRHRIEKQMEPKLLANIAQNKATRILKCAHNMRCMSSHARAPRCLHYIYYSRGS